MQTNIEERVKKEVAIQMCVPVESIRNDANIYYDLGADSLDAVELVMAIEDEFAIEISDEDGEKLLTVQQVIDYVEKATAAL